MAQVPDILVLAVDMSAQGRAPAFSVWCIERQTRL